MTRPPFHTDIAPRSAPCGAPLPLCRLLCLYASDSRALPLARSQRMSRGALALAFACALVASAHGLGRCFCLPSSLSPRQAPETFSPFFLLPTIPSLPPIQSHTLTVEVERRRGNLQPVRAYSIMCAWIRGAWFRCRDFQARSVVLASALH